MKTSSPYGPGMEVKSPPDTIRNEMSKAGSKAKARYPSGTATVNMTKGAPKGGGPRAMTPGTTPTGS